MKLYYSPGACSLSPHIVLCEAELPYTLEKVDLSAKKTDAGADYLKVNPKGYVPAIELDDGQILTEGPAVVQYLADRVPEKKLAPPSGTMERYRLQESLNFTTSELHKAYGELFNKSAPEEWKDVVRKRIGARLDVAARQLAGKRYVLGDKFTVADAYFFTILRWSKWVDIDLTAWPDVANYVERVAGRPAVQFAMKEEGLPG
jgi:glutathione S-transferase